MPRRHHNGGDKQISSYRRTAMFRFDRFASWAFTSVGIALIGAGILVVPSNALANAGSDCITSGGCSGFSGAWLGFCVQGCCQQSGDGSCCDEACTGDSNYTACYQACESSLVPCTANDTTCTTNTTPCTCPSSPTIWCP